MSLEKRYSQTKAAIDYAFDKFNSKYEGLHEAKTELFVVSKNRSIEEIETLIKLGHRKFAENKVQEAAEKWSNIKNCQLNLVGPLQTNKVKDALQLFDVIESVDREKLVKEILKHDPTNIRTKEFFIQVNAANEPQKSGVLLKEAQDFIDYCKEDAKLNVTGLMCIPPREEKSFPYFCKLLHLAKRHNLKNRSMGMSNDFIEAIECGSTQVRIGRAIFED